MTRRSYRVNPTTGEIEELGAGYEPTARVEIMTDSHYAGLQATDGTAIDSRRKHRAYMKANNLTLADDFKQTWKDAPAKRAQEARAGLREAIGQAVHKLSNTRRR